MTGTLKTESERLTRSWMRHEAEVLRDYLVADVEDPRLNLQSIFSRHFLVRALTGERFEALMEQEYRFSVGMNWLVPWVRQVADTEEFGVLLHALRQHADNAEGIAIPHYVSESFAELSAHAGSGSSGNYLESLLSASRVVNGEVKLHEPALNTFQEVWSRVLGGASLAVGAAQAREPVPNAGSPTVLEPACGSANDYRFLQGYGLSRWVDYTGFDLCVKNVENARQLFPGARFMPGNVFEIAAGDKAYEFSFTHDLFEHLSREGLQAAVREICRVTRQGLCVHFFNMDEMPEHEIRPVEEYHWNRLSVSRMKEAFEAQGFAARVVHIGSFLRQRIGSPTHNDKAYTFFLYRAGGGV